MTDTAAPDATPAPSWASPETEARVEALVQDVRDAAAELSARLNYAPGSTPRNVVALRAGQGA